MKSKIGLLYGGRSTEHEVSLHSAQNVFANLDKSKFELICIAIDKNGQWYYQGEQLKLINAGDPKNISLNLINCPKIILSHHANDHCLYDIDNLMNRISKIDVIYPMLHGMDGEDGAIQGLAQLANLPIVGPSMLSSAICMDKEIMKRILCYHGIKNADFITVYKKIYKDINYENVVEKLGGDLFIKPVNLGSSVGVSHVTKADEFAPALEHAFDFDHKVIIEKRIFGREIECAVLGNNDPQSSLPGEVVPTDGFYSYETKYVDEHGAKLVIPAKLSEDQITLLKRTAINTYQVMECSGLARVDMFLTENNEVYINELNTLPGFTKISMYPKLWELSGLDIQSLTTKLIELAMVRQIEKNQLKTSI